jgi:hypothetical protein
MYSFKSTSGQHQSSLYYKSQILTMPSIQDNIKIHLRDAAQNEYRVFGTEEAEHGGKPIVASWIVVEDEEEFAIHIDLVPEKFPPAYTLKTCFHCISLPHKHFCERLYVEMEADGIENGKSRCAFSKVLNTNDKKLLEKAALYEYPPQHSVLVDALGSDSNGKTLQAKPRFRGITDIFTMMQHLNLDSTGVTEAIENSPEHLVDRLACILENTALSNQLTTVLGVFDGISQQSKANRNPDVFGPGQITVKVYRGHSYHALRKAGVAIAQLPDHIVQTQGNDLTTSEDIKYLTKWNTNPHKFNVGECIYGFHFPDDDREKALLATFVFIYRSREFLVNKGLVGLHEPAKIPRGPQCAIKPIQIRTR